ncbi:MAG: hypothetical protein ACOYYU_14530 [Chloroflexota bacterium]
MEQRPVKQSVQAEPPLHSPADWLQVLDEENVQFVVLDSHLDTELMEIIRLQPEWKVDFENDELVIFTLVKR